MSTPAEVFEALQDRFRDAGGYEYETLEEFDQTGAPFLISGGDRPTDAVGIDFNEDGSRSVEVTMPTDPTEEWTYTLVDEDQGGVQARGRLAMTWELWNALATGEIKSQFYRLGGQSGNAAAVLEELIFDAEEKGQQS